MGFILQEVNFTVSRIAHRKPKDMQNSSREEVAIMFLVTFLPELQLVSVFNGTTTPPLPFAD
jgi:hypothetical protein